MALPQAQILPGEHHFANDLELADVPDAEYVRQVMTSYSTEFGGELKTAQDEAKRWRRMFRKVCRERKG